MAVPGLQHYHFEMPLTVIPHYSASTPADLVRLFHQSQLEWSRHLGEETQLDFGRWVVNPDLSDLPEANCLHDAFLPAGVSASQLMGDGGGWRCCSLNPSISSGLGEVFLQGGWRETPLDIFYRGKKISTLAEPRSDLTIIPARASYRHYRELMQDRAEAAILHLDDSHFDALLALRGGKPVGAVGVLTCGEVGTVREWYVAPEYRHQGIGRLLLQRAMEICDRSVLRHVMIGISPGELFATRLCKSIGFSAVGQWIAYTSSV